MKIKTLMASIGFGLGALFAQAQQTNVLFIIADDLGNDSLAACNSDPATSLPPTPTIDSFQANGLTFTRFYAYSTDKTNGVFILEIGWFDNDGLTLERASNLASNDWNLVAGQEFEDHGTEVLLLRDPAPPISHAFYRVNAE